MNNHYLDSSLSAQERTSILLPQMTIEEKIGQMMQIPYSQISKNEAKSWVVQKYAGSFLHVLGDDAAYLQDLASSTRLRIPIIFGIDAIHGHCLHNGATIFPTQLAMSCSWNKELINQVGRATAKEVAADGLHWTFSPVLCIGRDLRWGRINETFGEDPYLIGELASAIIHGYQGKKLSDGDSILSCAKHYIAYGESTGGRDSYDAEISMRKLKEVFLPPFKKAVEAGCATFMSGYQSIDGYPVSSSKKIIREILKDELSFNGFVVTDWNNTGSLYSNQKVAGNILESSKKVIEAGNDMIMNTLEFYDSAIRLINDKVIPESLIDESVKRILYIKFSMGLFEKVRQKEKTKKENIFACKEHLDINLKIARESSVLLENRNNILPLKDDVKKIAVIGPNADDILSQYGDWTFFTHPDPNYNADPKQPYYTMLSGIREVAEKKGIEVIYRKGCSVMNENNVYNMSLGDVKSKYIHNNDEAIKDAVKSAATADVIIAVVGDCIIQNGEWRDRADLNLSNDQSKLLKELKALNKPLIVVLVNGKPLSIPWVAENADAIIETFNSGMYGGKVAGEIIFGITNPSGKLTISFPYHVGQLPVYYNQLLGWHGGKYIDMPSQPLYSFGYGLSFSNFKYSNLKLEKKVFTKNEIASISVDVTNISDRDGYETVQLYVNDVISTVMTPVKQLKRFTKVFIKSGEIIKVNFELNVSELKIVDYNENEILEPGEFIIMVGTDSRDISLLKDSFKVN